MNRNACKRRWRLPWRGSTFIVVAFLALTILPAFAAHMLTPEDAKIVQSVEGWNGCLYVVRRGDDLFRIGLRYGVSYMYLAQLNGIYNPNFIYVGQVLSVPCRPPSSPYYPLNRRPKPSYPPYQCPWCQPFDIPPNCGPTISYTVNPGDNLFRIAVNNGSTIQWIRTQNNLWGKVLRPGVTLQVPCQGYVKYPPIPTLTPTPGESIATATPIPPPTSASPVVRMRNGAYNPPVLNVKVGTTVTWINREAEGGEAYTVTSGTNGQPNGFFNSGLIQPGGSFQFTFTQVGSYEYFSETNPTGMVGTIIVTP